MWKKIELLLDAKGMNWADLARLIGVKDSRISKWRSGVGELDRNQILRVARVLDAGVEYLADDSLEDPRALYRLPEDEAAILRFYRSKKEKGELDEDDAITGMAGMVRRRGEAGGPPVVLTGQAAREAIAASEPMDEVPQVTITQGSKLPRPRKKA